MRSSPNPLQAKMPHSWLYTIWPRLTSHVLSCPQTPLSNSTAHCSPISTRVFVLWAFDHRSYHVSLFSISFISPKPKGQLKRYFLHAAFLDSHVEVTYTSSEPHSPLHLSRSIIILCLEVDCTWLLSSAKLQIP